jgi:hypothetical protein
METQTVEWETCSACDADVRWSLRPFGYVDREASAWCDNGKAHFVYED